MILNTRNFALYLLSVGFLLVAIALTLTTTPQGQLAAVVNEPVTNTDFEEQGAEPAPAVVDREERLLTMREEVARRGVTELETLPNDTATAPVPDEEDEEVENTRVEAPLTCPAYTEVALEWNPGQVTFAVAEGARMMYRTIPTESASATLPVVTETLLQLPLRSLPLPVTTCLNTDVVGVALDGSLIRNNELSLYSIFEAQTLIGYALDGFPIYGEGVDILLDTCGGAVVEGQYRYHLDLERGGILNCFAGIPVEL